MSVMKIRLRPGENRYLRREFGNQRREIISLCSSHLFYLISYNYNISELKLKMYKSLLGDFARGTRAAGELEKILGDFFGGKQIEYI